MKIILWLLGMICFDVPICMLFSHCFDTPLSAILSFVWGIGVGLVMAHLFLKKYEKSDHNDDYDTIIVLDENGNECYRYRKND